MGRIIEEILPWCITKRLNIVFPLIFLYTIRMEVLHNIVSFFLHFDEHLLSAVSQFGTLTYGILFLIVFLETGLVVTPFLPGDSLLFAAGAISAGGVLNVFVLFVLLTLAAILGDTVNYWIGHHLGAKVFQTGNSRFFKVEYLEKTRQFYAKHGGKTIILARFVPIVRTFAPFVAGVGKMHYGEFLTYNIIGGVLWVAIFTFLGYFFGNLPFIQENFHYAVVVIVLVSVLPMVFEYLKHKKESRVHIGRKEEEKKIEKTFEKQHLSD